MTFKEHLEKSKIIISISNNNHLTFSFDDFKKLRNEPYFENCCDLFLHLKTQYSDKLLNADFYPLARLINEQIFNHKINWINTFSILEKENFAQVYRERIEKNDEIDVFDNILEAINLDEEINSEIDNINFRNGLIEGVREQLINENIIENN